MPLDKRLKGKRVAILAEDLYEDLELWYPLLRLQEEGAEVVVVGPGDATEHHGKYGYPVAVDQAISASGRGASSTRWSSPAATPRTACAAIRPWWPWSGRWPSAAKSWPPSATAAWMLASAEVVAGKTVTCFFAIKDDLVHAGATYQDAEVVVDGNLITSRQPADLPAFLTRHHRRPGGRGAVPRLPDGLVVRPAPGLVGHPWDRQWDIFRGDSSNSIIL